MNINAKTRLVVNAWIAVLALVLFAAAASASCASLKSTMYAGCGAGVGAAIGSVAPPVGPIVGAIVGGAVTHAVVEADTSAKRSDKLENKILQSGGAPPAPPSLLARVIAIPWWIWLVVLWVYLRRAHLMDALTGKEPRMDAILRALGIRTHKTPIPPKSP